MNISNFCGQNLDEMPSLKDQEINIKNVQLILASEDSLKGYANLIYSYEDAEVEIVPWPVSGKRTLVPGTGNEAGVVEDLFEMKRSGDILFANNLAVKRKYITGWYSDPASAVLEKETKNCQHIYTHEANYHPDSGQIFFPKDKDPFLALLAKPGDDVKLEDFVAFYCDGSFGIHIHPCVWHQPLFPLKNSMVFKNKQGRVHACVSVDFIEEFNSYIAVPIQAIV